MPMTLGTEPFNLVFNFENGQPAVIEKLRFQAVYRGADKPILIG
jgi:hypothetical protein